MKIERPTKFIESSLQNRLHPALTVRVLQVVPWSASKTLSQYAKEASREQRIVA